ncbi:MAG: LysR family transcriptional regulator [Candidatus Desulforudis sp.]|nr:LysR family transcriptional regulator [Desulforudis sp.]
MNLNYLETFVMVAKHKSFSRAAKLLSLTQPAVSKHIAMLEAHYGTKLVNRTSRRVELTDAGIVLYHFAGRIISITQRAKEEISSFAEEVKGRLAIGASSIPGHYLLPRLISEFKKEYPLVDVSLEVSNTGKIINRLREEAIHIGVVGAPIDCTEITCTAFINDELVLIIPTGHPLTTRKEVAADDLVGEKMIVREHDSGTRRVIEEKLEGAGVPLDSLQIAGEFGSTESVLAAVEAGLGISFVSRWAAENAAKNGRIELRTLKGLDLSRSLHLIYPRDRSLSRPTHAFLSLIK